MGWKVERFPNGDWDTGGDPKKPEIAESKVFWLPGVATREQAKKKAQGLYSRLKGQRFTCTGCDWVGSGIELDHTEGVPLCPNCGDPDHLEKK